ncbi:MULTISPECIES: ABC transporter ATP-binding protein [unclassified Thermosynechococcus]|uniref:ABC transporter ATP-binding protein n=1 Tax=unclassified Thermosynechococcus TaxID=2622553 RepID=UPI0028775A99|nr:MULTISPECIES: ABC transporter ATP-binding protein [unclassified Thermosynechococcus]WNC53566.1 ABC transporter ATP-binding protein [Thermosynechococcus sp. TG215]WNC58658.1 ABC transporter ATP-binding protein [Thermosynechococcus sp. TG218]
MTAATRSTDWQLLQRLIPYLKPYRWGLVGSGLLLIPLAAAAALQPIIIGQAIAFLKGEESTYSFLKPLTLTQGIDLLSIALLMTVVLRFGVQAVQGYWIQKIGQNITADIRHDLFDHVLRLSSRFFDRTPVGKLITRLTSDVDALGDVFATGAVGVLSDVFSMLVVILTMFFIDRLLATLLLALVLPITALIIYFQHRYRVANYKSREELSLLNADLQENIVGITVVQLFRREAFNSQLFRRRNQRYIKEVDRTIFYDSAVSATLEWIAFVAIAGVLWLGGALVEQRTIDFGTLATFILFSQRVFDPLRQLAEKFTTVQAGLTAIERIHDLLSEPIEIQDPDRTFLRLPKPENTAAAVEFRDVWLAYKDDDYVLKQLSFQIHAGEKVAIVGPTGAGKSSIIRLLCRLYDPTRGEVLVSGRNVRDFTQAELRQHIGVILQDSFLFSGDVKSNIALGDNYTLAEIQRVAAEMNIADFIEQLPQGYDTPLRQRGTNLSAGQRQLLALARVAIRNPEILVLDEATANLDVGTEVMIQEALNRLLVNRTAIMIAHRLATIRHVDRIFVLKRGQLVEQGTHSELLARNGVYAHLYRLQALAEEAAPTQDA